MSPHRVVVSISKIAKLILVAIGTLPTFCLAEPVTGPESERRFPPLTVPPGFRATLFACDPLVEYPSVIALGPRQGSLLVAHDYVTGLGVEIVRRDEVRVLRDTDGDGYADRSTVYAGAFNSIQGLASHAGEVFVMHAPLLTRLRDNDGDDVADERRDLLAGLGLPPEENPNRLHCANGVVVGHDGWLYLALGDRGCDVLRPEGDRLLFQQGGILRCRADGRDLHVFSEGLRNIYDICLDAELNVFVRDNENDGGDYMVRVCHCFHGSDHGYPYLYHERPSEALPPLADLGRGSSAGGTSYLETAFPREFRQSLFFCEWGRAVVRYSVHPSGSGFASSSETDFAAGATDDPYGFKPTDLVVDRDGSLLVSDWGDGQRPRRGRGRIYRIRYVGDGPQDVTVGGTRADGKPPDALQRLNSPSYYARVAAQRELEQLRGDGLASVKQALRNNALGPLGRLHAVWVMAHCGGRQAIHDLLDLAATDPGRRVRAQAIRAIADLCDPVLNQHRLEAGRGDDDVCRRLAELARDAEPIVRREVLVALGRLRWSDAPNWLRCNWGRSEPALDHAASVMLRRADNWPAVLRLLDDAPAAADANTTTRALALRALAWQATPEVADGLIRRLDAEESPRRRREYLDLLALIYRRPAAWTYWGFRPAPRPAHTVDWESTERLGSVLVSALGDGDLNVRVFAARRMVREGVPIPLASVEQWLQRETDEVGVAAVLEVLRGRPPARIRSMLSNIVANQSHSQGNRLAALELLTAGLDHESEACLAEMAESLQDDAVRAAVLFELGKRPAVPAERLLVECLSSANDAVRAAAAESLVARPVAEVAPCITELLADEQVRVRRAAASLAGSLGVVTAADRLLEFAAASDTRLRSASLRSLAALGDARAVDSALRALEVPDCRLAAFAYLAQQGSAEHLAAVVTSAEQSRAVDVLVAAVQTLIAWQGSLSKESAGWQSLEQAIARIQSTTGIPLSWRIAGPTSVAEAAMRLDEGRRGAPGDLAAWTRTVSKRRTASLDFSAPAPQQIAWLAATDFLASESSEIECLAETSAGLVVWLNGREVYRKEVTKTSQPKTSQLGPQRFDGRLETGPNRLLVQVAAAPDMRLNFRFRRKSSRADHERLARKALEGSGNAARGRELFLDAEKTQCVKCHRLDGVGGRIGPDLAGIGSRFSQIHIVEALLEPSRTVAPNYETRTVALTDGRVISGVKVFETSDVLTLGDAQGELQAIPKAEINEMQILSQSIMPDGLEQRLSERDFADLIRFLVGQQNDQTQ